MIATNS